MGKLETRRGVDLHSSNPFIPDVRVRTKRVTNKRGDMMLVSAETGEIQAPVAGFWERHEVDSAKFVKLFVNGVKALKELTNAGTKVFEVLYLEVQNNIGTDKVYMSFSILDQTKTQMSESTYTRGMRELTNKGFIAANVAPGWYWINPDYMWNGDRLAFVTEYYKVENEQQGIKQRSKSLASTTEKQS
jgi:Firmicute plasmid replication protein (RepL)